MPLVCGVISHGTMNMAFHSNDKSDQYSIAQCAAPAWPVQYCTVCSVSLTSTVLHSVQRQPDQYSNAQCAMSAWPVQYCTVCNVSLTSTVLHSVQRQPDQYSIAQCAASAWPVQYCTVCNVSVALAVCTTCKKRTSSLHKQWGQSTSEHIHSPLRKH